MIVPENRLLVWTAILVLPFAAILHFAQIQLTSAVLGLFLLLVLLDAGLGFKRRGLKLEFPGTICLTKDREGEIEFFATKKGRGKSTARIGLPFPEEINLKEEELYISLEGGITSSFKLICTPRARGNYLIENCHLETTSPVGFWALRVRTQIHLEIRVYPNLFEERKHFATLFLRKGNFGTRPQRTVGQGRQFEKLRDYIHGDSFDQIHWKMTAKRGRPVTKVYQIERTQEVYVIVDSSRLSARLASGKGPEGAMRSILERFIAGALILGLAARKQGDLFGLLTHSDKVSGFMRAKSGHSHFRNCRELLYALKPRAVTPDFDDLFSFIGTRLRRRALLIFLTSLDDPLLAESFLKNTGILSKRHLLLVGMMLPDAVRPLFSGPPVGSEDDIYGALGGHICWHGMLELEKALKQKGVRLAPLINESFCPALVSRYMDIKEKQLI